MELIYDEDMDELTLLVAPREIRTYREEPIREGLDANIEELRDHEYQETVGFVFSNFRSHFVTQDPYLEGMIDASVILRGNAITRVDSL